MEPNKENPKKRFDAEAFEKAMRSYFSGERPTPYDELEMDTLLSAELSRKLSEGLRQEKQRES